ncbi:hypothetical protein [Nostoc sp. 'Peltigera malacea cyanobiont' DB3992]|nr:hypothetical protein [Nostoc sp. 'Peltigera malacea cyanobiont' DB3992]
MNYLSDKLKPQILIAIAFPELYRLLSKKSDRGTRRSLLLIPFPTKHL